MPPRRRKQPRTASLDCLGEAVRQIREQADMSQEVLAEKVGTDLRQIGGIERGDRNPSYTTLVRLADALETRVSAITSLADDLLEEGRSRRL